MEDTNNVNNNSKTVWLTIIFVVVAFGVLSLLGTNPLSFLSKKQEVKKEQPKVEELSIDKDIASLESRSKFPSVTVKSSVDSGVSSLSKDLAGIVLSGATSVVVKKETYTNGNGGWSMSYVYPENVMNAYNKLYTVVRDLGYKIDLGSRTFSAAIVSGESSKYKIKVISQYLDDKTAQVRITLLENK